MFNLLRRAPARFAKSFGYCFDAMAAMWRKEESFRLEIMALIALVAVMLLCDWSLWKKVLLVGCYLLVPLAEAFNSGLEDVCDLITLEQNELVKNAKDKGALAVLLAIIVNCLVLAALVLED